MTLREDLARRLARLNETEEDWRLYLTSADECIRQMEWARRGMLLKLAGLKDTGQTLAPITDPPLTLAPEGWTP